MGDDLVVLLLFLTMIVEEDVPRPNADPRDERERRNGASSYEEAPRDEGIKISDT
jgi:hypothetical protein